MYMYYIKTLVLITPLFSQQTPQVIIKAEWYIYLILKKQEDLLDQV